MLHRHGCHYAQRWICYAFGLIYIRSWFPCETTQKYIHTYASSIVATNLDSHLQGSSRLAAKNIPP
uniref:Uncharacterized protein n=1 Tax=Anguilla anguilla TaxID=7936 RepID=A0A0E9VLT5_ANGAN